MKKFLLLFYGYEEPTPVQRETIPLMIAGRDLLAQAATGTGKTAAFALPMIHALAGATGRRRTCGVVLVPTRELAMQVAEAIHRYARGTGLSVVPLYGGASMQQQIRALDRRADIVVATPGRALDHSPAAPGRCSSSRCARFAPWRNCDSARRR